MKLQKLIIKNFRGIKEQEITDIGDAVAFIGQNNSGKSAILTAIRFLYGDYAVEEKDFYKDSSDMEVEGVFHCDDFYLNEYFLDSKIGIIKNPSNSNSFEAVKTDTVWEDKSYSEFRSERQEKYDNDLIGDVTEIGRFMPIWLSAVKSSFNIVDELVSVKITCNKSSLKASYEKKDISVLLPKVAFIDDTRNFTEEENGKSRTITSSIFSSILNSAVFVKTSGLSCENCKKGDCDKNCIEAIKSKTVSELTYEELEKLVNYRVKSGSDEVTQHITEQFAKNYRNDFKINIKATSNINKSFSISTRIYDPALNSEIELSNVGAGVRSIYILSLLQVYQTMQKNNTIFVIEEPELYLHPQLQKSMAKTISEISKKNQVFFTTHSPLMLKEFLSSEIRKVRLNELDYFTIVEKTLLTDILDEIGYSTQDIINTDFVVFVEGDFDKEVVELLLEKYYDIDLTRILVIDTKSCKSIGFYASLRFLDKTKMEKDFAIIRDCDTQKSDDVLNTLKNQLKENISDNYYDTHEDRILITEYSSMEGFLFSPELLVKHKIYNSIEEVYVKLMSELSTKKGKAIQYFEKQNRNDTDRVNTFKNEYDDKVAHIEDNMDWLKKNFRGHNYFDCIYSKKIATKTYIDELPEEKFNYILKFFDKIDYFKNRRK